MTSHAIPLLLTLDVHGHPKLPSILLSSADKFSGAGQRVTYFISADLIRASRDVARSTREIASAGHTVGCHGLDHDVDPFTLSKAAERESLRLATEIIEDAIGAGVKYYRAPDFRLTPRTLPVLDELGYDADCSVTSRRLPLLSSCPWCYGWILAPARPYHPSLDSPFKRGSLRILEIPTTSFVVPMAHGLIANGHHRIVRQLMRAFLMEARRLRSTVLVPMIHPESMLGEDVHWSQGPFRLGELLPRKNGGVWLRYRFRETDNNVIQSRVNSLLLFLRSQSDLASMSMEEYVSLSKAGAPELLTDSATSDPISVA